MSTLSIFGISLNLLERRVDGDGGNFMPLRWRHVLLDIGCGSLRGGSRFIPYLGTGNYLGVECESDLIESEIEKEIGRSVCDLKKPQSPRRLLTRLTSLGCPIPRGDCVG
jgi:hypothetical protein